MGRDVERHAARDPVLHLHGADPRALGDGRGPARHDRSALRPDSRRSRLRGDLRRRVARGHDRCRRGQRDFDGTDIAADHASLRVRPTDRLGHHRGIGHARADHPAIPCAHHHGRPARPIGGRHVCGGLHPGHRAGGTLRGVHPHHVVRQAGMGSRPPRGGAHLPRAGWFVGNALVDRAHDHRRRFRRRVLVPLLQPAQARCRDRRADRALRERRGGRRLLRRRSSIA